MGLGRVQRRPEIDALRVVASGESSMPPCTRAISSMFRRGFPTWNSILQRLFPSNGSSC
jgi:hypothetical protein